MNTLENLTTNPVLQSITQTQEQRAADAEASTNELGQDAFLRLMIAQLNNQDPLNPQENGDFIAQLAQFSSVEGITNINNSINALIGETRSTRTLDASGLVGQSVEVDGDTVSLIEGQPINGSFALTQSSPTVTLQLLNAANIPVYTESLGTLPAGEHRFALDGVDSLGQQLPAGTYRVVVNALEDGNSVQVPLRTAERVDSVFLSEDDGVILNLASGRSISVDDARRITATPDAINTNGLSSSALGFQSNRVLVATGLIGKSIDYQLDSFSLQDESNLLEARVDLPVGIDSGIFSVNNLQGETVFSEQVSGSGSTGITWNGVDNDGGALPAGEYRLSFVAGSGSELESLAIIGNETVSQVDGIGSSATDAINLRLANGQQVSIDQLLSVVI